MTKQFACHSKLSLARSNPLNIGNKFKEKKNRKEKKERGKTKICICPTAARNSPSKQNHISPTKTLKKPLFPSNKK